MSLFVCVCVCVCVCVWRTVAVGPFLTQWAQAWPAVSFTRSPTDTFILEVSRLLEQHNDDPVSAELRAGQECARCLTRDPCGGSVVGFSGKARLTKCLQRLYVHFHKPAATAKTALVEGFVNIWNTEWLVLLIKHLNVKRLPIDTQ